MDVERNVCVANSMEHKARGAQRERFVDRVRAGASHKL